MSNISIGFTREDGGFQLLATVNDNDKVLSDDVFGSLESVIYYILKTALPAETIEILYRQDAPDYIDVEEENQ